MPTINVEVDGLGKITLTDQHYLASGGEGNVYAKDKLAFKIYHDPSKMIPEQKIKELLTVKHIPNILGPQAIIRDVGTRKPIGFTSNYIKQNNPLCKYFTKDFRQKVGFDESDAVKVVEMMQNTISQIHNNRILIVDLNEMNFLVGKNDIVYFIDVDSWQTPNFKATALMESVRDRLVKNNQFTELSDWFSFAVVAFQIYIGVHPYKGMHPDYKPKDWSKRMDDGISVFDQKATIPASCRPLTVVPQAHLRWFEDIFKNNARLAPPIPGAYIAPVVAVVAKVITQKGVFKVSKVADYKEDVVNVYSFIGRPDKFTLTKNHLYMTSRKETPVWQYDPKDYDKVELCNSPGRFPLICKLKDGELTLDEVLSNDHIAKIPADNFMVHNGILYTVSDGQIYEYDFVSGKKVMYTSRIVSGCMKNSTKVFDGVIYQDMLGQAAFTIPFEKGCAFFNIIKELKGYRVLDAKSEGNILVVLAESNGIYSRFVIVFNKNFSSYTVRVTDNVSYDSINFTKIENGPCILVAGDKVEAFFDNAKVQEMDNPPFDHTMKLFNSEGKVYFINENEIYSVSTK
jgi:serine/threonine protein kinase